MTQPSQNNSKTELSCLDPGQIAKDTHIPKDNAIKTVQANCLVPNEFTKVEVTYVTSGNGIGEIETATYYDAGIKQESTITPIGDQQPETEITTFTFTNDLSPTFLSQKHLKIYDSSGSVGIYFALDGDVTVPPMTVDRFLKVDILTGDSPSDIGSKFVAVVNSDASFVATGNQIALVTHVIQGFQIDAEDVDTEITIVVTTQGQEPKQLNNTYYWLYRPTGEKHHVWHNIGGAGVDPNPAGTNGGIEVIANENATSLAILNANIEAINSNIYFSAKADHKRIIIYCDQAGPTSKIEDFNTGFGHLATLTPGENKAVIRTLVCSYDVNDKLSNIDSF